VCQCSKTFAIFVVLLPHTIFDAYPRFVYWLAPYTKPYSTLTKSLMQVFSSTYAKYLCKQLNAVMAKPFHPVEVGCIQNTMVIEGKNNETQLLFLAMLYNYFKIPILCI
jgi:hypothetical protein